jgi:hypothetical protein
MLMPRFSAKALIVSNLTHWGAFAAGFTACIIVYLAVATIATDGASAKSIFHEMRSSIWLGAASIILCVAAPLLAGYVGAKLAPEAKFTHGALATSSWLLFNIYCVIWGPHSTGDHVPIPEWLDLAVSYAVPFPALLGAYLWQRRQELMPKTAATVRCHSDFAPEARPQGCETPAVKSKRSVPRLGSVIGTFVFIIMSLLLTEHEKSMLLLAMVGATAIMILVAFVGKKFRSTRS